MCHLDFCWSKKTSAQVLMTGDLTLPPGGIGRMPLAHHEPGALLRYLMFLPWSPAQCIS